MKSSEFSRNCCQIYMLLKDLKLKIFILFNFTTIIFNIYNLLKFWFLISNYKITPLYFKVLKIVDRKISNPFIFTSGWYPWNFRQTFETFLLLVKFSSINYTFSQRVEKKTKWIVISYNFYVWFQSRRVEKFSRWKKRLFQRSNMWKIS